MLTSDDCGIVEDASQSRSRPINPFAAAEGEQSAADSSRGDDKQPVSP